MGKNVSYISKWRDLIRPTALMLSGYMCLNCKASDKELDVHHKDGNRANNDQSNLVVLCKSCHRLSHLCKTKSES